VSGRPTEAVLRAVRLVERGHTVSAAAKHEGLAVQTVRRQLRRAGHPPLDPGKPRQGQLALE